jgi:hypothetical protein
VDLLQVKEILNLGYAGTIEALHVLGERFLSEFGINNPFAGNLSSSRNYPNLTAAMESIKFIGDRIKSSGIPKELHPLTISVTGSSG